MKFQSAISSLAAVALASSSLDSVSSFVPKSCSKISPAATLPASQSYSKIGQHQSITQLHVASSEIVGDEADVKPRKTREVRRFFRLAAPLLPNRTKPSPGVRCSDIDPSGNRKPGGSCSHPESLFFFS